MNVRLAMRVAAPGTRRVTPSDLGWLTRRANTMHQDRRPRRIIASRADAANVLVRYLFVPFIRRLCTKREMPNGQISTLIPVKTHPETPRGQHDSSSQNLADRSMDAKSLENLGFSPEIVVPSAGFEPATHGLGNRCSIP
jgi:hypothetical protein